MDNRYTRTCVYTPYIYIYISSYYPIYTTARQVPFSTDTEDKVRSKGRRRGGEILCVVMHMRCVVMCGAVWRCVALCGMILTLSLILSLSLLKATYGPFATNGTEVMALALETNTTGPEAGVYVRRRRVMKSRCNHYIQCSVCVGVGEDGLLIVYSNIGLNDPSSLRSGTNGRMVCRHGTCSPRGNRGYGTGRRRAGLV